MKKRLITITFFLGFCSLFWTNLTVAQNNSLSVSLSHPIPVGDTFYSAYNGIGGVDLKYGRPINDALFFSGNLGYSRLRSTQEDEINLTIFQAGLGLSTRIGISPHLEFRPELELGYALVRFYNKTIALENETSELFRAESEHLNGLQSAILLSWNYKFNEKFLIGIKTGYEFIYIPRGNFNRPYNQEMHEISVGLQAIINL